MTNKMNKSEINPGPWSYDNKEHCLIDRDGNVIAEFYESDNNGISIANMFNEQKFKALDYNI